MRIRTLVALTLAVSVATAVARAQTSDSTSIRAVGAPMSLPADKRPIGTCTYHPSQTETACSAACGGGTYVVNWTDGCITHSTHTLACNTQACPPPPPPPPPPTCPAGSVTRLNLPGNPSTATIGFGPLVNGGSTIIRFPAGSQRTSIHWGHVTVTWGQEVVGVACSAGVNVIYYFAMGMMSVTTGNPSYGAYITADGQLVSVNMGGGRIISYAQMNQ